MEIASKHRRKAIVDVDARVVVAAAAMSGNMRGHLPRSLVCRCSRDCIHLPFLSPSPFLSLFLFRHPFLYSLRLFLCLHRREAANAGDWRNLRHRASKAGSVARQSIVLLGMLLDIQCGRCRALVCGPQRSSKRPPERRRSSRFPCC